jgi:four helix bundle protein
MLSFQKLDVYKCAIQLLQVGVQVRESLPRGHGKLADQLNRASMSIPLNIAEGYGKTSPRDKRSFYAVARGSAMESAAIFDVLLLKELITQETYDDAMKLAERVIAMLTKMCR